MKLNKLKGISDISEEILIERGISDISVIQEEGFNPRMYIKYKDSVVKTIDDINEMEAFIQTLKEK
jgi:hypothetical protein